jgi:hypothetical protein
MMPKMAWLPAWFAPTLHAASPHPLVTGEAIGRGRLRGRRGILLPQRELPLQIIDLACLVSDLFRAFLKLATQSLILAPQSFQFLCGAASRVSITIASPWLHWPERTELRQRVQEV